MPRKKFSVDFRKGFSAGASAMSRGDVKRKRRTRRGLSRIRLPRRSKKRGTRARKKKR